MFDGDVTGRNAIRRAMDMYDKYSLRAYKLNFIPVYLPKDTDPDEYLFAEGVDGVRNKLKESKDNDNFV